MQKYKLLLWAYNFSTISTGILGPIYAYFVMKVGGGILETAYSMAIFSIASGSATLLATRSGLYHKYKVECLYTGWLMWVLGTISYLFIDSVTTLLIAEILNGLGSALSNPIFDAEYSQAASADLVTGWGDFEGLTNILTGLSALVGGAIAHHFGFKMLIYLIIFTAIISFAILVNALSKPDEN